MKISGMILGVALLVGVGIYGGFGSSLFGSGQAQNPDAFVGQDSVRILGELEALSHDSMQGRRTGEAGGVMAQNFLVAAFQEAGLVSPPSGYLQPFEFRGRRDTTQVVKGANVVGFVPGQDSELGAFVLTAHFDHLGIRTPRPGASSEAEGDSIFNGADDDASGTAAIISLGRYFVDHPPRHTIVIAAVDAEEMGLRGSRAFVEAGWPKTMALNVNLDMIARSDSLLFAAGPFHYPHLRPILERVPPRPPVVIAFGHDEPGVEGVQDWTRSSDHAPFHQKGIPFIYFGVEDHPDYHRASDEFDRIDQAFYLNAVRTVLVAIISLDLELDGVGAGEGYPEPR
jgi:Zn-dependent M28 family amino/carboxypeptidase